VSRAKKPKHGHKVGDTYIEGPREGGMPRRRARIEAFAGVDDRRVIMRVVGTEAGEGLGADDEDVRLGSRVLSSIEQLDTFAHLKSP